jgi:HlyD family secretion protein
MSDNIDTVSSEPPVETEPAVPESGRHANWLLWALPVLAVLALIGIWYSSRPQPVPLQGTVEATEVNVATKMMARVEQVSVSEGATVSPGQLLATLSSPGLDALVSQSQADLDSARALDAIAKQGVRPEDIASLQGIAASSRAAANLAAVTAGRMSRLYAQG